MVIHINQSRSGLVLFCLTRSGIERVHQSPLSSVRLRRQVLQYVTGIDHYRRGLSRQQHPSSEEEPFQPLSSAELRLRATQISEEIITPFADIIEMKEHVIFIPTQELVVFPLSSLMHKDNPLFLTKAVSQAPSLSVFQRLASRSSAPFQRPLTAIYATHEPPFPQEPQPGDGFIPMVASRPL